MSLPEGICVVILLSGLIALSYMAGESKIFGSFVCWLDNIVDKMTKNSKK